MAWRRFVPHIVHRFVDRIPGVRLASFGFAASFAVCLFLSGGTAVAAEIGQVIGVVPGAFVAREGKTIPLALHSPVEVTDTLTTDATGRVRVLFNDDSTVAIGSNTSLDLRDYADSGAKPVFDVHLMQGVARVVTGRVVEMNPSGFKVTTPEAHVGIRGTIISLRSTNGVTTVYVENTTREVYVNDIRVPGGQKITLPDDPLRTEPIQPEDRRGLGRDLAFLGGRGVAAAAPEPGMTERLPAEYPLAYVSADGGTAPPDTPLKNLTLGTDLAGSSLITLGSGYVAGSLATTDSGWLSGTSVYADFVFTVNLGTGAVSNAEMHNSTLIGTTIQQFEVVGGSGVLSGGTTVLSGFTGQAISYTPGSFPYVYVYDIVPADATTLTVTSSPTPGVLGSSVAGNYDIVRDVSLLPLWLNVDTGTLNGTWDVPPPTPTTGVVSGNLFSATYVGVGAFNPSFSFDINLTNGWISNASVNGSGSVNGGHGAGTLTVDFINGSGNAVTGISNFTLNGGTANNYFNSSATPLDSSAETMSVIKFGSVDYDPKIVHNGGIVPVLYFIGDTGGMYDDGYGAGTMVK